MTQHRENQYDDDLTVGMDDYESFSTDSINLFEFTGDDDSPIARLKTIILSIDWEINDDILQQLREELLDLSDVWSGDKIKQVYIQGLDKIGKYIFKERANAHPNAIKLLLTFYYNLERIVSSDETMSEDEKKKILLEDVRKFDQLKAQISKSSTSAASQKKVESQLSATMAKSEQGGESLLKTLKAHVLGIDWEINDRELQKLSKEVERLEGVFSQSKAKLILLQGIGALSSYINKMRSQSNSNVFALLHSFYGALEKITLSEISEDVEKKILLAEVAKFNKFKLDISREKSESPAIISGRVSDVDQGGPKSSAKKSAQIFPVDEESEVPDQDEEESKVAFDVESRLASVFGDIEEEQAIDSTDVSALAGVNVETDADDDSDEEALPYEGGTVAPALVDVDEESRFSVDSLAKELAASKEAEVLIAKEAEAVVPQGIDVETEADDDSDEDALPMNAGDLAPALSGSEEDFGFTEDRMTAEFEDTESGDLENRLDSFFGDEIESSSDEWGAEEGYDISGDEAVSAGLSFLDEEIAAPAFAETAEPPAAAGAEEVEEAVSAGLSFLDEEVAAPAFAETAESPAAEGAEEVEEDISAGLSFLDEEIAAPAFAETAESPAAEGAEEVEEDISAGLSFLDEEVAAPAFAETAESPAAAGAEEVEEAVSAGLSFLDEEVAAPAFAETAESPAAAGAEEVEEDISAGLSFLDEEVVAPAFAETAESPAAAGAEEVEEEVSAGLSFLDEEVAAPAFAETAESPAAEGAEEVEEAVSAGLSFLDEEAAPTADEIDEQLIEEQEIQFTVPGEATAASAFEEVVAEEIEDDDVIEFVVPGEELVVEQSSFSSELQDSEEVLFEVVADDVKVDPLPAEDSAVLSSSDLVDGEKAVEFVEVVEEEPVSTKPVEEEEQLFEEYTPSLPGASQPVVAAVPQSLEEEEQDLFSEEFADSPVETEESSQESLLQAEEEFDEYSPDLPSSQPIKDLAEDNELDLFSEGEEKDSADFIETEQEDQGEVTPTAVLKDMVEETAPVALLDGSTVVSSVTGYDENELATLRSCVDSLQDDITDERIQSLFNEINSLRSRQVFGYTEKIFLQLLSSICQHIRNSRIDFYPMSLQVLEKVFSALEVSHSARSTADQTQQQLLECTSQVLLLQQKAVSRWQPEDRGDELKDVSGTETTVETDRKITSSQEVEGHVASETEKMLLAVFQQEMAQMRQTFFDEISSLRKELADRQ